MKIHNYINKIIAIILCIGLNAVAFGQGGEILNFDGIDDYGDMGDVAENLEEITMEVWVNPASITGIYEISYKDAVSSFSINNGQVCVALGDGFNWYSTTYCSNSSISAGTWSHLAFSVDGDSIRIFINGTMDFGDRFTNFIGENASSRYLGAADDPLSSFGGLTSYFEGDMDDFRIWEYGRCEAEIINDMNCEANLAAAVIPSIYYTFNQGISGADNTGEPVIFDASGTFEDAAFNGFALNGGSSNFFNGGVVAGTCSTLELPNIQVIGNTRIPINEFNTNADFGNDFGFIDTLGHDSTNVFSIFNSGFSDLNIYNLALASADGSDAQFQIASISGQVSPVTPSNGFNISLKFAPTQSGIFDAEFLIDNDDCEDSLFIFALHGEACFDPIIDSIEGGTTICEGDSTTLIINGNLYNSGEWVWYEGSFSGTPIAITQDTFLIVKPLVTTTYYLRAENGCYTNSDIDSFTVQVDPVPIINLVTDTGNDTICELQEVALFDALYDDNNDYSWSTGETSLDTLLFSASTDTTVYLQAINILGCPAFDSINLTVLPNPIYSLSTDTGNDTICLGQEITLQANEPSSSTFGNVLNYFWSNNSISDTAIVSPITTTTYYVTGSDAFGCGTEDSITITVLDNPIFSLSTDTGSDTICLGQEITLQANEPSSSTFGNVLNYFWSNNSISDTAIVSPITTTTYYVTGSDAFGCGTEDSITITVLPNLNYTINTNTSTNTICLGETITLQGSPNTLNYSWSNGSTSDTTQVAPIVTTKYYVTISNNNGCSTLDSITITVNNLPTVTPTSNTPICIGETLQLNETGGNATNWTWSGNGLNSTLQNPTQTPTTSGTYKVVVSDVNNCSDSATVAVIVNSLPNVSPTSNSPICIGETLQLNETGGNATNWTWSGNGLNSTLQNPTQTPTTSGTYKVVVSDVNNCSDSATVAVIVNSLPNVSPTSNTPICIGETLQLNETGGNATNWTWSGNGLNSTLQNPTQTPTTSGTYKVVVSDVNNCMDSATVAVTVNNLPTVNITGDTLICENEDLILSENGGAATSWDWSGPNGFTNTNQNPIINAGNVNSGNYQVIGTDGNNCSDTATLAIVAAQGQAFISNLLIPQAGCAGDSLHFIEISQTTLTPTSILWDFGDGATSTERDPSHTYITAGTYMVKVTVSDQDCANHSIEKTVIINDCRIGQLPSEGGMIIRTTVAPNPAQGRFSVNLALNAADDIIMELYDLSGTLVDRKRVNDRRFIYEYFEPNRAGIYFLKIRTVNIPDVRIQKVVVIE